MTPHDDQGQDVRESPVRDGTRVVLVFIALIVAVVLGMIAIRLGSTGGGHGGHDAVTPAESSVARSDSSWYLHATGSAAGRGETATGRAGTLLRHGGAPAL